MSQTSTTYSTNGWHINAVTVPAGSGTSPQPIPKNDLITTRAVELADGWLGQVVIAGQIVKERPGFESSRDAAEWAAAHIAKKLARLFA